MNHGVLTVVFSALLLASCQATKTTGTDQYDIRGKNIGTSEWQAIAKSDGILDVTHSRLNGMEGKRLKLVSRTIYRYFLKDSHYYEKLGENRTRSVAITAELLDGRKLFTSRTARILHEDIASWSLDNPVDTKSIPVKRVALFKNEASRPYVGLLEYNDMGCLAFDGIFGNPEYIRGNQEASGSIFHGWYCVSGNPPLSTIEDIAKDELSKISFRKPGMYGG